MAPSPDILLIQMRSVSEQIENLEKDLEILDSLVAHSPVGFATFTAKHGSSVINQLNTEIDFLDKKMRRQRLRDLQGNAIGTRPLNSTNSVLRSYIEKEQKEVENGMIRQYFTDDRGLVVEPKEFPAKYLQIRIGKGQPASTHAMLRQQNFNTDSLSNQLKSLKNEYDSLEAEMKSNLENALLKLGETNLAPNRWSESATDMGSEGGFLICTSLDSDYRLVFCPHCSQKLINAFNQGIRRIVFPPLPKTILNLKVFCTENEHKNHPYEDCIGIDDLENKINQVRERNYAPTHHTEVVSIPNQQLSKSHGDWIWLSHN